MGVCTCGGRESFALGSDDVSVRGDSRSRSRLSFPVCTVAVEYCRLEDTEYSGCAQSVSFAAGYHSHRIFCESAAYIYFGILLHQFGIGDRVLAYERTWHRRR